MFNENQKEFGQTSLEKEQESKKNILKRKDPSAPSCKEKDPLAKKRKHFKRILRSIESEFKEAKSRSKKLRTIKSDTMAAKPSFPKIPKSNSDQYLVKQQSLVRVVFKLLFIAKYF